MVAGSAAGLAGGVEARPGAVEPALADVGQPLAPLPQRQRLLQRGTAGLQLLHDGRQLRARLLVREFLFAAHSTHGPVTVAANSPAARRTRRPSPVSTPRRRAAPRRRRPA